MANSSIEVEGYRVQAVDNGDGTYSLATSTTLSGSDVTMEWEGIRFRLTPVGANDSVTGEPLYAFVTGT